MFTSADEQEAINGLVYRIYPSPPSTIFAGSEAARLSFDAVFQNRDLLSLILSQKYLSCRDLITLRAVSKLWLTIVRNTQIDWTLDVSPRMKLIPKILPQLVSLSLRSGLAFACGALDSVQSTLTRLSLEDSDRALYDREINQLTALTRLQSLRGIQSQYVEYLTHLTQLRELEISCRDQGESNFTALLSFPGLSSLAVVDLYSQSVEQYEILSRFSSLTGYTYAGDANDSVITVVASQLRKLDLLDFKQPFCIGPRLGERSIIREAACPLQNGLRNERFPNLLRLSIQCSTISVALTALTSCEIEYSELISFHAPRLSSLTLRLAPTFRELPHLPVLEDLVVDDIPMWDTSLATLLQSLGSQIVRLQMPMCPEYMDALRSFTRLRVLRLVPYCVGETPPLDFLSQLSSLTELWLPQGRLWQPSAALKLTHLSLRGNLSELEEQIKLLSPLSSSLQKLYLPDVAVWEQNRLKTLASTVLPRTTFCLRV